MNTNLNQLECAIYQLFNYLEHEGCDINYTDVCTCGLRKTRWNVITLLNAEKKDIIIT